MQKFSLSIERADGVTVIPADETRFGPMTDQERRETAMLLADRDDTIRSVAIMQRGKIVDCFDGQYWSSDLVDF